MKKFTIAITFAVALMAFSCDKIIGDYEYDIRVINNTNHDIEAVPGLGPDFMSSYPDTAISELEPYFVHVHSHDHNYIGYREKWETVFPRLPADTLSIYIFSTDTLKAYPWSVVRSGYKILKRYDLSLKDLEKANWVIKYP